MKQIHSNPPRLLLKFFRWFCHPKLKQYIEGDLMELYSERLSESGKRKADVRFIIDVLLLFRPGIIGPAGGYNQLNNYGMFKNYFKIGCRNLLKQKSYSVINIGGLAIGLAVAMMIGLWVYDELSYNKHHQHYDKIAVVLQNITVDGEIETWSSQSYQLGQTLRANYGGNFKRVVVSTFTNSAIISNKDKAFTLYGNFMESQAPEMLSLKMLKGTRTGLQDPSSILLSASAANKFFGDADPIGEALRIDNKVDVKIAGVYQDLPSNSSFKDTYFIAPLDIPLKSNNFNLGWINNWLEVYVQLADNVEMSKASDAIRNAKLVNVDKNIAKFKPELFLHAMPKWHLYSDFENGVNVGGRIESVILLGTIGAFVLLLACINFMNLSTARSEKRAKEVGVRKVIGSVRSQLITQFFCESLVIVTLAYLFSILLVQLFLPLFNFVAVKNLAIAWDNPWLWIISAGVVFVTSMVAGSYPAFFLSAFRPVKVLKGTFRVGRSASIPRKVLVVIQFTVSVILIMGTIIVYNQIQFVKNRSVGYETNNLLTLPIKTEEVLKNFQPFRNDLLKKNIVSEMSMSECTIANMWWSDGGFGWSGKDPEMQDIIYRGVVTHDFGKTVGWKIKEGRDFSREFSTDSSAMILNEAAVKYMGFKDPVGETIKAYGRNYTVIGVVEDMITQSLYEPAKQTIFILNRFSKFEYINVRLNRNIDLSESLKEIESTFLKYNSSTPFEYNFTEDEFADKFASEERLGQLAGIFSVLAILISCLGLFGLASFVSEQRTKELGIRKVLGASVIGLWKMLSKDFVILVIVSCLIAIPVSYYLLEGWLMRYDYRTKISWWVFGITITGALVITLLTVSFQAIKAALANPVKSLRSE